MDVWVLRWECPNDNEVNVTIWANEQAALNQALDEIEDHITNNWDMDDEDQSRYADEIGDLRKRGQLREAMLRWNDYQDNFDSDYGSWWGCRKQPVLPDDEVVTSAPTIAFKATSSGATCRGPCGQSNSYAYADRQDGTYVCRQCSTFQHIFGVSKS